MVTAIIADDSTTQQDVVRSALSQLNIKVVGVYSDGVAALQAIRSLKPTLALLDYIMPNMTGGEVSQAVYAEKLATKVVLVTSMGQRGAAFSTDLHAHSVAIKPISSLLLSMRIQEALDA